MQGGKKNPTEKDKETPKKPLGVLSLLSSSSDQGVPIKAETNLGTGGKLEKTVPRGLGSATSLLKVCQIFETPQRRGYGRQEFQ